MNECDILTETRGTLHRYTDQLRLHMRYAAYLDESSDEKADSLFVLGGWLAPLKDWQTFSKGWQKILDHYRLSEYHASDCANRRGEFNGWSDECVAELQRELLSVIEAQDPTGIGVSLNLKDYKKCPESKSLSPYHACWQYCLIEAARKVPNGKTVSFILDQRAKTLGKADKIKRLMKKHPDFERGDKIGTVASQPSHEFPPLQAADWLAYEIFRHAGSKKTTEAGCNLRGGHLVTYQEFFKGNICTLIDELKGAGFFSRAS